MKFYRKIIGGLLLGLSLPLAAQHVDGTVSGPGVQGQPEPLPGVNVYWSGTQIGTITNNAGHFRIHEGPGLPHTLVFSFVGYVSDTVLIEKETEGLVVTLSVSKQLEGIEITGRSASNFLSRTDPIVTHHIGTGELQKAACCNLSESFETSPSVDVNYSDALSGAKQIKLLGLAGKYSLIQTENFPNLRGLGNTFGLSYIPGPWMESIQVSKGAASVKNGYESTTGQINVEYKKPHSKEKLHLNGFISDAGRVEGNANIRLRLNERLGTMLFLHSEHQRNTIDMNMDGFLDVPLIDQVNLMNRWEYEVPGKRHMQFGFKVMDENRDAGQMDHHTDDLATGDSAYGIRIDTRRYEVFTKNGFIFSRPATSLGIIASAIYHDHASTYGMTGFDASQTSLYLNAIFETYIGNTFHKITAGTSMSYDAYDETFRGSRRERIESVPGVYAEYAWSPSEKFTLLTGLRADHHSIFGLFYTPRIHLRYSPTEQFILRASAGKGYRTPYLLAENTWILASSRELMVVEEPGQEEAWNYGVNITRYFDILGRELRISVDAYRTDFINQLVVDLDRDQNSIYVYNLTGKSFANSVQAEAQYALFHNLDVTAAFRFNDVRTTTNDILQDQPLVNRYKGLISLSWQSGMKRWQADLTTQFNGSARLPSTSDNPLEHQRPEESPNHTIILGQLTRYFKKWSVYLGGENLLNFMQENPIIAADEPYGPYFDAASIWGPVHGRKVYAGFRYTLE